MATAIASVQLMKTRSYSVYGRTFWPRKPVMIDDIDKVRFFRNQPEFSVTLLEVATKKGRPRKQARVEADPLDVLEAQQKDLAEAEAESDEPTTYSQAGLMALKKPALRRIAKSELGLEFEADLKKAELVDAMLLAQENRNAGLEASDEDDEEAEDDDDEDEDGEE